MNKYYTLIGSRSTPDHILVIMRNLVYKLSQEGWIGRSGGADGCDSQLELGVFDYFNDYGVCPSKRMEIFLPWKDFNGRKSSDKWCYTQTDHNHLGIQIAKSLHPAWDNCSQGAKKLHTRNVNQVLGINLDTPSKFIVCYSKPKGTSGGVTGGTATAVKLGLDNNIEIINLYKEEHLLRIKAYIES